MTPIVEYDGDRGRLTVVSTGTLAVLGVAAASIAFWGGIAQGALGGGTSDPQRDTLVYLPPNAPVITAVRKGDSALVLSSSAFAGDQDDTHASTLWQIDTAGADFSSPIWTDTSTDSLVSWDGAGTTVPLDSGGYFKARNQYTGAVSGLTSDFSVASSDVQVFLNVPGASFGANEPDGMTFLADRSFTTETKTNWWGPQEAWGRFDIVSGEGGPEGDNSVASTTQTTGTPGGQTSAAFGVSSSWIAQDTYREIYGAYYIKFQGGANPYVGHPSGVNKTLRGGVTCGRAVGLLHNWSFIGAGQPFLQFRTEIVPAQPFWGPNVGNGNLDRGEWYLIEVHAIMNSGYATSDGEIHAWVNGVKTHEYTGLLLENNWDGRASSPNWCGYKVDDVWGGLESTAPYDMAQFYDRMYVSAK